jgi:hypothetical protein
MALAWATSRSNFNWAIATMPTVQVAVRTGVRALPSSSYSEMNPELAFPETLALQQKTKQRK